MNTNQAYYYILLFAGWIVSNILFYFREKKDGAGNAFRSVLLCSVLELILGYFFSKLFYLVVRFQAQIPVYGFFSLLRLNPEEFSFFGGCFGVTLAVVLSGRIAHRSILKSLDSFSAPGILFFAIAKAAEFFLGTFGLGEYIDNDSFFCFFPAALQDPDWGDWFMAVFAYEAITALAFFVICLAEENRCKKAPGLLFERAVFRIAIFQLLFQMLRTTYISYSFVRTDQLLWIIVAFIYLVCSCNLTKQRINTRWISAFSPAIWMFAMIGVNVFLQFALDKPYLFVDPLPISDDAKIAINAHTSLICYSVMILSMLVMLFCEHAAAKRRIQFDKKGVNT